MGEGNDSPFILVGEQRRILPPLAQILSPFSADTFPLSANSFHRKRNFLPLFHAESYPL